jgi:flagellar operon protein
MADGINPAGVVGVRPRVEQGEANQTSQSESAEKGRFQALLDEAQNRHLQFSNHAIERLDRREIPLTKEDIALLSEGVSRAEQKGSKESLLLMDDTAFLINVEKRKVITAVDKQGMKEKTFTNIDSAILLSKK